jgi:hypothetical protein
VSGESIAALFYQGALNRAFFHSIDLLHAAGEEYCGSISSPASLHCLQVARFPKKKDLCSEFLSESSRCRIYQAKRMAEQALSG